MTTDEVFLKEQEKKKTKVLAEQSVLTLTVIVPDDIAKAQAISKTVEELKHVVEVKLNPDTSTLLSSGRLVRKDNAHDLLYEARELLFRLENRDNFNCPCRALREKIEDELMEGDLHEERPGQGELCIPAKSSKEVLNEVKEKPALVVWVEGESKKTKAAVEMLKAVETVTDWNTFVDKAK